LIKLLLRHSKGEIARPVCIRGPRAILAGAKVFEVLVEAPAASSGRTAPERALDVRKLSVAANTRANVRHDRKRTLRLSRVCIFIGLLVGFAEKVKDGC